MATTVHVKLGERSYDIRVGRGFPRALSAVKPAGTRALIVSDSNVDPIYGAGWEKGLAGQGFVTSRAVVPAGESSKDCATVSDMYARCADAGLDRDAVLVALGGGVVGDLTGFVAATYLRGVRFAQAPTSLLAMVDSSVGGKTGVNLAQGKNLVGAFHQPVEVIADVETLKTLPKREYVSGLAEVVKCGAIRDAELFGRLECGIGRLAGGDLSLLEGVIVRCCEIKAEVVERDERECGLRAILNFGHTLGHALEQALKYESLLHGEAVAIGMMFAALVSVEAGRLSIGEAERLRKVLVGAGLPARPSDAGVELRWSDLRGAMSSDKKARGGVPHLVLADRLGAVSFGCVVEESVLEKAWRRLAE